MHSSNRVCRRRILSKLFYQARKRAGGRGVLFELEKEDVLALWEEQEGICLLSGVPFILELPHSTPRENPWRPSIDRIDPVKGYVIGNVRLVCKIGNYAKNGFTDKDLLYFCENLVANLGVS